MRIILAILFTTLALIINAQPISEIQGDGTISPYNGMEVMTSGVVTQVSDNGWMLQTPDGTTDNDVNTSEGIFVYTGTTPTVSVGDIITLTASVQEYENVTELYNISALTVEGFADALPTPIVLDHNNVTPSSSPMPDLEKYEGMRISFDGIICGPASGNTWVPFYVSANRPMREAGIAAPAPSGMIEWDNNPELLWMRANTNDGYQVFNGGMQLVGEGVLHQSGSSYEVLPDTYQLAGAPLIVSVEDKAEDEITVASINVLWLLNDESNYSTHVKKVAKYIAHSLKSPDIIALQEIGGYNELEDLSFYIRQEDPSAEYEIHFLPGNWDLHVGYLVKEGILSNVDISQPSKAELLDYSPGQKLHDRPPLLLTGNLPTGHYIQLLNVHIRSLNGITGSNSAYVRNKRHEQAQSIAHTAEELRDNSLIILGDFNAFPFSDGYVDVINQIAGTPSLGAIYPVVEDIVSSPLTNLTATLPPEQERYSYVYQGNANLLDNCLANDLNDIEIVDLMFARGNADNSIVYEDDLDQIARSSDHDGFVLYLRPEGIVSTVTPRANSKVSIKSNPTTRIQVDIEGGTVLSGWSIYNAQGILYASEVLSPLPTQHLDISTDKWPKGVYFLYLDFGHHQITRKIIII